LGGEKLPAPEVVSRVNEILKDILGNVQMKSIRRISYCQFSGVNVPPVFGKDAPLFFGKDVPPVFGQMHHSLEVGELL
jgi:hypothetical protein